MQGAQMQTKNKYVALAVDRLQQKYSLEESPCSDTLQMEEVSSLRSALIDALGPSPSPNGEQELFDELMVQRARLLKVFDFGTRNAQELRELESGKIEVEGRSLAVNAEFTRQVTFLSQHLQCSERYCAGLLHSVLSQKPNLDKEQAVEKALLEFHRTRRELADCLRFIFEASVSAQDGYASRVQARVNEFSKRYLVGTGGPNFIANRMFAEITRLGEAIGNTKTAVTSAVSDTKIPTQPGAPSSLGHAILSARLESLNYERRTLCFSLFFITRAGFLTSAEIQQMLDSLSRNSSNGVTYYILAAVLAALDLSHSSPESQSGKSRSQLTVDTASVSAIRQKLSPISEWKDQSLKATLQLKWTLFLTELRFRDQSLENKDGFRNEDLELQVLNAVQGNAFQYLMRAVTQLRGKKIDSVSHLLADSTIAQPVDMAEYNGTITDESKDFLLHEFELLMRSLLAHAPAELRKIKHKQEDQFRPRTERFHRTSLRASEPHLERSTAAPRNDIAMLFHLIGALYSLLPSDSAVQFWGGIPSTTMPAYYELAEADRGRLPSFFRWAIEVREPELIIGVFDMLSGLSKGQSCSEFAYNFLASGTLDVTNGAIGRYEVAAAFTWGSIFGELESWAAPGHQRGHHSNQLSIAPTDALLGLSFLKLLASVVTYSVQARIAIYSHPQFRAITSLVSLIPLRVPLELKGAIYTTLTAFCQPGAGVQGVEICKNVWALMERLEVINVRGGGFATKGVEVELEEIESTNKVYPATIPFLELLSTLIHTPKRVPLKNRVLEPEPIQTIPDGLGHPYRHHGIGPFVAFVVDTVLSRIPQREFLDPADSWRMTELALSFVERCLASYDLESLPSLSEAYSSKGPEVLLPILQHPGFEMLSRILADTPLRATILSYTIEGSDELQKQQGKEFLFSGVLLRALRIVDRVLVIQDLFLDHLVPALSDFNSMPIIGKAISSTFLSKLDQSFSYDHRSVPAIAAYVNYPAYPELVLLSIKILTLLSQSTSIQNLAQLIERSADSAIILDGFVRLLETDSSDNVADAEEWADFWTGAGAPDVVEQDCYMQAIRLAVLDLMLHGTRNNRSSSLAFFLLFGSSTIGKQIHDPHGLGARTICIHVILLLINIGVPRLDEKGKERQRHRATREVPFFEYQPTLAERLYKLIYQLSINPKTSAAVMLYLRTREDFFARHLAAMTFRVPADEQNPYLEVVYGDGSRVTTSCAILKAFIGLRSWLLNLVSLELHILTSKMQHQRVNVLLDLLFGSTDATYIEDETDWEQAVFQPFNDISQSHIRLIELFQSLQFEWYDSVAVTPMELDFYKHLNLQSCLRTDDTGCEIVDRAALFQSLSQTRKALLSQGQISTPAHNLQLDAETKYILESCVVENNRREVQFFLSIGFETWKTLVDIVLTKCFGRMAADQRENILFDLLHVVPPYIRTSSLSESSVILLSELFLLLINKLREERRQMVSILGGQANDNNLLPVERMHNLLQHIMECILDNNRGELVRGNLYGTLTNYLHLIPFASGGPSNLASSIATEDIFDSSDLSYISSTSRRPSGMVQGSLLETGSVTILKQAMDRIIMVICRDALDGSEVWKTVAFTLLDSLSRVPHAGKLLVLNSLEKYGLLVNFIHGIKEADPMMQAVLRPEPDDLNPIYVYEAKLSFLIRLSQSRQGAERLLETRLLPILTQVDFLDARPELDKVHTDFDSFLPSSLSRYHQILMPTLQLIISVLATLGHNHSIASKQALDFLRNHRDTFVILLKDESSRSSLPVLQELDLIITLCNQVVPIVPQNEIHVTNSTFGSIHNAILMLASRYISTQNWTKQIRPSDEAEILESTTVASGYAVSGTKFDRKVADMAWKFRKSLLTYLNTSSGKSDSELTVVLLPVTNARKDDRIMNPSVPLPTLNHAIEALNDFCDNLVSTIKQIVDISAELEHRDQLRVDDLEDIVEGLDTDQLRRLDHGQRKALIGRVFEETIARERVNTENNLSAIEMLLLLIWRHLEYYAETRDFDNPNAQTRPSSLRFVIVPDATTFQQDASLALERVIEKVENLELNEQLLGSTNRWRSSQSYIEVMCRRIRETVTLRLGPRPES